MSEPIDALHLGRDRAIGVWALDDLIIDPGPESCLEGLLPRLPAEPRALLLTHIHLDHAGASGALARRFPRMRVYVHEVGAPHLADPSRLLASASRLYGDRMDRLWGEVLPVPEERIVALRGGETVEGMRVQHTPGHAGHHVCYLDEEAGTAYVGDVAGVRIPPSRLLLMPTPPPEIDLEAWLRSIELVDGWRASRLRLTHFGEVEDPGAHLALCRERLGWASELARAGREEFMAVVGAEIEREAPPAPASRYEQVAPVSQLYAGLERYWRRVASPGP